MNMKWLLALACVGSLAAQPAQAQSTQVQLDRKNLESQPLLFTVQAEHGARGDHFRIFVEPKAGKPLPPLESARLDIFRGQEPIAVCEVEAKQRANGKGIAYGFFVSSKFVADSTFILVVRSPGGKPRQPVTVYVFNLKNFANPNRRSANAIQAKARPGHKYLGGLCCAPEISGRRRG